MQRRGDALGRRSTSDNPASHNQTSDQFQQPAHESRILVRGPRNRKDNPSRSTTVSSNAPDSLFNPAHTSEVPDQGFQRQELQERSSTGISPLSSADFNLLRLQASEYGNSRPAGSEQRSFSFDERVQPVFTAEPFSDSPPSTPKPLRSSRPSLPLPEQRRGEGDQSGRSLTDPSLAHGRHGDRYQNAVASSSQMDADTINLQLMRDLKLTDVQVAEHLAASRALESSRSSHLDISHFAQEEGMSEDALLAEQREAYKAFERPELDFQASVLPTGAEQRQKKTLAQHMADLNASGSSPGAPEQRPASNRRQDSSQRILNERNLAYEEGPAGERNNSLPETSMVPRDLEPSRVVQPLTRGQQLYADATSHLVPRRSATDTPRTYDAAQAAERFLTQRHARPDRTDSGELPVRSGVVDDPSAFYAHSMQAPTFHSQRSIVNPTRPNPSERIEPRQTQPRQEPVAREGVRPLSQTSPDWSAPSQLTRVEPFKWPGGRSDSEESRLAQLAAERTQAIINSAQGSRRKGKSTDMQGGGLEVESRMQFNADLERGDIYVNLLSASDTRRDIVIPPAARAEQTAIQSTNSRQLEDRSVGLQERLAATQARVAVTQEKIAVEAAKNARESASEAIRSLRAGNTSTLAIKSAVESIKNASATHIAAAEARVTTAYKLEATAQDKEAALRYTRDAMIYRERNLEAANRDFDAAMSIVKEIDTSRSGGSKIRKSRNNSNID